MVSFVGLLVVSLVGVVGYWGLIVGVGFTSTVDFLLILDQTSLVFSGVLGFVVLVVFSFSSVYLGLSPSYSRFWWGFYIFVLSMVLLIVSSNFVTLLVGWDGLGLSSFFLISFYSSARAWSSSMKTFLANRFGDGLLLCAFGVFLVGGGGEVEVYEDSSVLILLSVGLITKSAQFPFIGWLPAAMTAPTPVSALVHSSTLVTSGVFLLLRLGGHEGLSSLALWTIFLASVAGFVEVDVKKVIAFSTLSQVGFMVFSLSQGLAGLCLLHLLSHALFKANLFVCGGYFLLENHHSQDSRLVSGGNTLVYFSFLLSLLNLNALGFLSGFYSKDALLDQEGGVFSGANRCLFLAGVCGTALYSLRLLCFMGGGISGGGGASTPLWLSLGSIGFGWVTSNSFLVVGWENLKVGVVLVSLLGFIFAVWLPGGWSLAAAEYSVSEGVLFLSESVGFGGSWLLDGGVYSIYSGYSTHASSGVFVLGQGVVFFGLLVLGVAL